MLHSVSPTLKPFAYFKIQTFFALCANYDQQAVEGEDAEAGEKEAPKEAETSKVVEQATHTTATQGNEDEVQTEKEMILG